MTNLLEPESGMYKPPCFIWKKTGVFEEEENQANLNNEERPEVTEDFSDSPFADRKPLEEDS